MNETFMKKLTITNFKSLKSFSINGLKRVNLLTGKNNTGKSSILEALSLYAIKGNVNWIKKLLDSRGEIVDYRNESISADHNLNILSSLFNDRKIEFNEESKIKITTNNDDLSLGFIKFTEEESFNLDSDGNKVSITRRKILIDNTEENVLYGLELKSKDHSQIISLDRNIFRSRISSMNSMNFHLIDSKGNDIIDSAYLWDQVTLSEKEEFVVEALKIVEPYIDRLSFIGEDGYRKSRYPIVKLKSSNKIFPLKAMGDGINRILNLTLALVNSDNGYLFIDEFENGLHHSVQEKLWEIIFNISIKLDIQVFVTTHSEDSINSFAKILSKSEKYEGALYRLERKDEYVKANAFSEEEIKEASLQKINLR